MDKFMKHAIKLANKNVAEGGQPYGAVLVKDGKIAAEGVNELHIISDVSGHAEMEAMRKVQADNNTIDLSDYIMYASGEPCPMCLGAMYLSGIKEAYYCQSVEDAAGDDGTSLSKHIYEEFKKNKKERSLLMKQIPLESVDKDPIEEWREKQKTSH